MIQKFFRFTAAHQIEGGGSGIDRLRLVRVNGLRVIVVGGHIQILIALVEVH